MRSTPGRLSADRPAALSSETPGKLRGARLARASPSVDSRSVLVKMPFVLLLIARFVGPSLGSMK